MGEDFDNHRWIFDIVMELPEFMDRLAAVVDPAAIF